MCIRLLRCPTRWIALPLMNNSCSTLIGPFTLCEWNFHQSRKIWAFVILNLAFVCCFFCYLTMDDSYMLLRNPKPMSPNFHLFILCTVVNGRALSLLLFQSGYTRTIEQHTDKTTFIIFHYQYLISRYRFFYKCTFLALQRLSVIYIR